MSLNRSLLMEITKKMDKPSKPKVPRNQWQHPGEITRITSNKITMEGVGFPVMGIPDIGIPQLMLPGEDYHFPDARNVVEIPMMAYGGHGGLDRWFAEKWVDVKTGKPCGRQEGESRKGYPACRPSRRVNEDTPKTSSELSSAEREKFKREKTSSDRIDYQHRRREFGGEQMYNDMEDYKSGGNVPTNPSLWSRAKALAKQKYDVYPSAYANGWAAKWYKSKGGGWRKGEYGMEVEMQQGGSLYDYMAARGMDASYKNRKKMFDKYFSNDYAGTAEQNMQMLQMLRHLEKPNVNIAFSTPAIQAAMPAYSPGVQNKPIPKNMKRVTNKVDDRNWFERTLGLSEDEVTERVFDLPTDVYEYYQQYGPKNKGKKFGIVSKQNARGYFFDEKGNLVLDDEVGLGKDKGDAQPVFYKTMTTPSGAYTMNRAGKGNAADFAKGYGSDNFFYIQHTDPNKRIKPAPDRPNMAVSAAVHGIPTHLENQRLKAFDNDNVDDNRMSAGCINCKKKTLDNPYFTNFGQGMLYVTPEKAEGGAPDNPGFRALPPAVQQKIMDNMAAGGEKMPPEIARARFVAAGNAHKLDDYGYAYGGYMPDYAAGGWAQQAAIAIAMKKAGKKPKNMADGGQPDGDMALTQINAVMDKLSKLKKFIQPDTDLEPWESSKFAVMDHYADALYDNMMFSPEQEEMMMMAEGGIPERYKNMGFTRVGAKRNSTRPGKKWMVLAKKGDDYKVVHGGYDGMKDYTQHGSEKRRERFWDRMGGKDSAKAQDPFSPLYWHKRFGTWKDGGSTFSGNAWYGMGGMPCFECGGMMKMGGQPQVGDEMEVTPQQMEELKKQGYTFEVI